MYKKILVTLENGPADETILPHVAELAQRFGIQGIPTMILFHHGKPIARQSGAMPAGQIVQWVRDAARG